MLLDQYWLGEMIGRICYQEVIFMLTALAFGQQPNSSTLQHCCILEAYLVGVSFWMDIGPLGLVTWSDTRHVWPGSNPWDACPKQTVAACKCERADKNNLCFEIKCNLIIICLLAVFIWSLFPLKSFNHIFHNNKSQINWPHVEAASALFKEHQPHLVVVSAPTDSVRQSLTQHFLFSISISKCWLILVKTEKANECADLLKIAPACCSWVCGSSWSR